MLSKAASILGLLGGRRGQTERKTRLKRRRERRIQTLLIASDATLLQSQPLLRADNQLMPLKAKPTVTNIVINSFIQKDGSKPSIVKQWLNQCLS